MSEQTLRNITICNSDFTQYTQSSPYLTPLQPPQTPNEIHFHSTPASIHRSQSNFSFHESYMAPTITCPPNFSQILATSENTPPPYFTQSSTSSSTHSSDQVRKTQYETSALSTSTSLKRSLDFPAKTCLESEPKLPRLQWSEKVGPQIKKTLEGVIETYDKCGALTYQQQLSLFHGIITYLYMYAEPVTVMTKSILAVTVHAVAQVIIQFGDLSDCDHCKLILEPSLGKYTGPFSLKLERDVGCSVQISN